MKKMFFTPVLLKLVLSIFVFMSVFSCKKSDDAIPYVEVPSNTLGTFTGNLSYGTTILVNAKAVIVKVGDTYTISYGDNAGQSVGATNTTGLRFVGSAGNYSSASTGGSISGVSITATSLSVSTTNNGKSLAFDGSK
jgi:hypothetical protein